MAGKCNELIPETSVKIVIIGLATLGAIIFDYIGQIQGVSIFAPLLFFLPIILVAYWYPKNGVLFALIIGILQLILASLYSVSDLALLTYATATASFYVLVAVGIVVSALSGTLKEQEVRYYAMFDHSEVGVMLISVAGGITRIEEINRRGGEILGQLPGDLAGTDLGKIWSDRKTLDELLEQVDKGINSTEIESRFLVRDGQGIPVLISAAHLPGKRLVITFIDITERKKVEEDIKRRNQQLTTVNQIISITSTSSGVKDLLKKSYEKVQDLFPVDSGGIYLLDAENRYLEFMYATGREHNLIVLPDHFDVQVPPFNDVLTHERAVYGIFDGFDGSTEETPHMSAAIPVTCETQVIGVLYLISRDSAAFSEDDRGVLESVGREIGCALMKLRLSEELIDANRKANLYLDILVHDINNANLASLGYGDLLAEMLEGRAKEMALKMIEGVQKSREIIRNLETIRHIQEKKTDVKPVNINTIINQEIRHFPSARIDYHGADVRVLADDLLGETLTNLLGNSIKFGGPGVTINILVSELPDGFVAVAIEDDGPGVPDELKPVIFNRFQKGSTKGSGKGLGLYIAKTLIERYGGRIWVEDRVPGDFTRGAAIKFTLHQFRQ